MIQTAGEERIEKVVKACDIACSVMPSTKLWLLYTSYLDAIADEGNEQAMREVFERAIASMGSCVPSGVDLWKAFLQFESEELEDILEQESAEDQSQTIEKVRRLFKSALSLPFLRSNELLAQYVAWETSIAQQLGTDAAASAAEDSIADIASCYESAKSQLEVRKHFEALLEDSSDDPTAIWLAYIQLEKKLKDPNRIQVIFRRAVCSSPLNEELWFQFSDYLMNELHDYCQAAEVLACAVVWCHWSPRLWHCLMTCVEHKTGSRADRAGTVKESALDCLQQTFQSANDYIIALMYGYQALRRLLVESESPSQQQIWQCFVDLHQQSFSIFKQYYDAWNWGLYTLQRHAAITAQSMAAHVSSNNTFAAEAAKWGEEAWDQAIVLLQTEATPYMECANYTLRYCGCSTATLQRVRSLYRQSLHHVSEADAGLALCDAWETFEREACANHGLN